MINKSMIVIVGLGNPGPKYKHTRHNIGFMIVESLKLKVKSFSDWKNNKKLLVEISKGEIAGQKIILAKPQTFMNESGKAVKKLISNFQFPSFCGQKRRRRRDASLRSSMTNFQ